jgi:uncharacterized membrane protein YeaQ/YmgE (transglycosylase-associated protein family)
MQVVVWLIAGGVVGWVAGLLMKRRDGLLLNIIIGIVGSILGGWFIAPLVGVTTIDQGTFTLASVLVSLAGAIILLAIVNIGRRGRMR